jgi:polysaccharide export outer membrane protein
MNKKRLLWVLMLAFMAVASTSCITPKKVRYLQDMEESREVLLNRKFEAVISPSDELSIIVQNDNMDDELANPFNINGLNTGINNGSVGYGYLVDVNGNIEMPVLGQIHVAGLTRLQLIDTIKTRLMKDSYMSKPRVDVRFSNFQIFILNANGGRSITISNERCTLLEALALSGAADLYTRRDKIGVLREVDGHMVLRYLDPRSSKVFEDPFFMLEQNDIILTDSFASIYFQNWLSSGWSVVASVISVASSLIAIYTMFKFGK